MTLNQDNFSHSHLLYFCTSRTTYWLHLISVLTLWSIICVSLFTHVAAITFSIFSTITSSTCWYLPLPLSFTLLWYLLSSHFLICQLIIPYAHFQETWILIISLLSHEIWSKVHDSSFLLLNLTLPLSFSNVNIYLCSYQLISINDWSHFSSLSSLFQHCVSTYCIRTL